MINVVVARAGIGDVRIEKRMNNLLRVLRTISFPHFTHLLDDLLIRSYPSLVSLGDIYYRKFDIEST